MVCGGTERSMGWLAAAAWLLQPAAQGREAAGWSR